MARREREARAFGAVEHMMPSRQGDKNNRYLVGHAAFGQGLMQLERCEFEDASASLEGAWSVWKEVFLKDAVSSSDSDTSELAEEDQTDQHEPTAGSSCSSSSSRGKRHTATSGHGKLRASKHSPAAACAERFFRAKGCQSLGKNSGGRLPPKRVGTSTSEASLALRGFADEPDALSEETAAIGVDWPPVHHLDTFASCFNDALALRIQKEAEDEAFACALEAQQALGRGKPLIESDDEIPEEGEGEQEQEEEDLSTEAYHRRMYKRDVQMMMKPESKATPPRIIGAKPQFHHFRRLMRGLCHCYVRLRRWVELDNLIEEAMPYFGHPVGSLRPSSQKFKTPAMEDLWISLTLQEAIACLLVGQDHFPKARRLIELVRNIEPKRRSLACAFRSIRFLQEQVQSGTHGLTVADKDVLLTNAFIALKES